MLARAELLRVTGVAGDADFVAFAGFIATLIRFDLFVAFLDRFDFFVISSPPWNYPAYIRGEAYLAAHRGSEAAAEFQKMLDHKGLMGQDSVCALAHLQIGRAYAMQGDSAKAKAAYDDFLKLWKDADPDIPILIAAKAEYTRLQ